MNLEVDTGWRTDPDDGAGGGVEFLSKGSQQSLVHYQGVVFSVLVDLVVRPCASRRAGACELGRLSFSSKRVHRLGHS